MDFLYSLKYYCQRWPRAKMYARMLGFLQDVKAGVLTAKGSGNSTRQAPEVRVEENATPTSGGEKEEGTQDSHGTSRAKQGLPANYSVNRKMLEHNEELDGHISELGTPMTDVFLQEFLMFAYCLITKDRKGFVESKEGFTYIKCTYEQRQTAKVMSYLYGENLAQRDMVSWSKSIKFAVRKQKLNATDEQETDFIDIDYLITLYVTEYQKLRSLFQRKLGDAYNNYL
jgi:hypothetical protein